MKILIIILLIIMTSCSNEKLKVNPSGSVEMKYLVFPGSEKTITISSDALLTSDIGIDFDINKNDISSSIVTNDKTYYPKQIPGTSMPLSFCNIPVPKGGIKLKISHKIKSHSIWVSVRIKRSMSSMCTPSSPVWDDYVVKVYQ